MSAWSPQDAFIVRKLYANTPNAELAAIVGRAPRNVAQFARKQGLRKSAELMTRKGLTGHQEACRRTQFRAGRKPSESPCYQPVGTLRLTRRDGVLERKVSDDPSVHPKRRWIAVTRLVWEAANGTIPPGHAVVFREGRQTTDAALITPESVELVSRAELMRRNSVHTRYPELAPLIQLRGALNRKINRRAKA